MINNNNFPIKVFVFGTLRKGGRLDYYMGGSKYLGKYYTKGQLMKSELGSAYINFNDKKAITLGEVYFMDLQGLLRIDHLESTSREFPKGYDLDITPIWKIEDKDKKISLEDVEYAFIYKRRNEPQKIISGDWIQRKKPVDEIIKYLHDKDTINNCKYLIEHMRLYLNQ